MIGAASFGDRDMIRPLCAHDGFWACMDTFKEQKELEDLYAGGNAPSLVWNVKGEH